MGVEADVFAVQGMIAQSCLGAFIGALGRVCCHMPTFWRLKDVTDLACECLRHGCIVGFDFALRSNCFQLA